MTWLVRSADREMGLCPDCGSSVLRDREGLLCLDAGHQWEFRHGQLVRPVVQHVETEGKRNAGNIGQRVDTIVHGSRFAQRLEKKAARLAAAPPAIARLLDAKDDDLIERVVVGTVR